MGYSSQRKSSVMGNQVYGLLTIPSAFAGICPTPQSTEYVRNILPEIFFGFYDDDPTGNKGFDIGIRVDTGATWVAFAYGTSGILASNSGKQTFIQSIAVGDTLYMKAWISGGYVYLNVSKTSYTGTDLLSTPWSMRLVNSTFAARGNSGGAGYRINRELAIANNPTSYETSGCYAINMKFLQCGFVTNGGTTYVWNDANSYAFAANSQEAFGKDANNRRVIRLRKDGAQVNTSRIKLISRTNSVSTGATETVSIDFRNPPQI